MISLYVLPEWTRTNVLGSPKRGQWIYNQSLSCRNKSVDIINDVNIVDYVLTNLHIAGTDIGIALMRMADNIIII